MPFWLSCSFFSIVDNCYFNILVHQWTSRKVQNCLQMHKIVKEPIKLLTLFIYSLYYDAAAYWVICDVIAGAWGKKF